MLLQPGSEEPSAGDPPARAASPTRPERRDRRGSQDGPGSPGTASRAAAPPAVRAAGSLRLLVLSWRDAAHPEAGGAEVFLERVTSSLARRGHDVTVLSARYPGSLPRERAEDGRVLLRRGGRFGVYPQGMAAAAAARRRYDAVVDIQNGVPFWAPAVTRAPVLNVVHHVHREQWPEVFGPVRARLGWFLESRAAPRVYRDARYVAVSLATRDELVALGVAAERIDIVTSGMDPLPVSAPPRPDRPPTLVVLGRLVPHKRVELAMAAVARLRGEVPGLRLQVVGHGYWAPDLKRAAAAMGVADAVDFLGFVSDEQKADVLAGAAVNLLPSVKEGWGLAIVEAASVGTPSVALRSAGGTAESILDGVTGLLADGDEDFVARTRTLLLDPVLRAGMGAKAQVNAARFEWSATADGVEDSLRRLVAGRR